MRTRLLALLLFLLPGCAESSGGPNSSHPNGDVPPSEARVVFAVEVPASTPEGAEVWISGNHTSLGAWSGHGVQAVRVSDRHYEIAQAFPPGTDIEFKVTRGSWETVEKGARGEELQNRRHHVAGDDTLVVVVESWRDQVDTPPPESTLTGDIRVHAGFESRFVRARTVLVYVPPGYEATADRYPVLYVHDGQNVFDRATSFLGIEWGVDETAEGLILQKRIEPLVIVAVYNTPDRIAEYTPVADGGQGGDADDYGKFLVQELKPFIDATYRTRPGRADTGVLGSSLGGLVSIYHGLALSPYFSKLGVVSPSVWWGNREILRQVDVRGFQDARIWLDMGTAESGDAVQQARTLRDALLAEGWVLGQNLSYAEIPGARHDEAAWAERVDEILLYLFPAR